MFDRLFRFHSRRSGGASVEFGLVLPFLLLVILGMADAGWIFYNHGVLTRALRAGCRQGAVVDADGDPSTTAKAAIGQLLEDWRYHCPGDEICEPEVTVATDAAGRDVLSCTIAVPVASLTGFVLPLDGVTLSSATRTYVENWESP
jgi:hypothetical protein